MEYRQLGASGLNVPVLSFGTATFGGGNEFFKAWGDTQLDEAKKLIDLCLDAGVNFFDTANVYSRGTSEEILGKALEGIARDRVLISTKVTFKTIMVHHACTSSNPAKTALNACKLIILMFTTCTALMVILRLKKRYTP